MVRTNLINNALAQLRIIQITAANTNRISASPAAQNSVQKGLELAKEFEQRLDIEIPAIATALVNGKTLSKSQLEEIVCIFEEKGWNSPKTLREGWMNREHPSADWIECLLHGGSSQWAIELLHELEHPTEISENAMTPYEKVFSRQSTDKC
ncbi:MAG TPA: hypothetical protein V6D26_28345 [Stenomitos sp.]